LDLPGPNLVRLILIRDLPGTVILNCGTRVLLHQSRKIFDDLFTGPEVCRKEIYGLFTIRRLVACALVETGVEREVQPNFLPQ